MRKRMAKFLSLFLTAAMACSLLSVSALAELVSGEKQSCTFQILYVSDEFNLGYNYDEGGRWNAEYICQYQSGHSGVNHSISCADIKAQLDTAKTKVNAGWEIVGWSKECSAAPRVLTTYTGTTATQTSYTIYLVAKRPAPAEVTYTLSYDANGGSGAPAAQTAKSSTGSAAFAVSDTVPVRDGYDFLGWAESASAAAADYHGGDSITVTADKTLYAVWKQQTHRHHDEDGDGFCDDDQMCMHAKDTEGYCTVTGCTHPDQCCPKRTGGPAGPTEAELQDILGADFVTVTCETRPSEHRDGTYGLLSGGYTLGAVQGDDTTGYTVRLTLKKEHYAEAFGTDTRKAHAPAEGETDREITLNYDRTAHLWALASGMTGVTFRAVCSDKSSQPGMVKRADGQTSIGNRKPGDNVVFTLHSTVPTDLLRMNSSTSIMELVDPYTLVFHDTMNEKLESDYSDLKVTIGSMVLDPATDYTVATTGLSGGETLNVTLDLAALYNAGKITKDDLGKTPVVVSYTAKVVDDAVNGDTLRNDAFVTFPGGTSSISTVIGTVVDTPHTGGPGTVRFTVLGLTLLGGAAALMALRRRKEDAEN